MSTATIPSRWLITAADLSDDPDVFPFMIGQSFLQLKTPVWSTDVKVSVSGKERRRALWSYPRWKFRVAYEVLRDSPSAPDITKLFAFFNSHAGQAYEFFYNDRSDNAVSGQPFGLGDGTTTTFQLKRSMSVGRIGFTEPVFALNGVPVIAVDGIATTAFTVGDKGKIVFDAAPAVGAQLTWSGRFLYVCRFGADELDPEQMMQGLWSSQGIEFQSVK